MINNETHSERRAHHEVDHPSLERRVFITSTTTLAAAACIVVLVCCEYTVARLVHLRAPEPSPRALAGVAHHTLSLYFTHVLVAYEG